MQIIQIIYNKSHFNDKKKQSDFIFFYELAINSNLKMAIEHKMKHTMYTI